MANEQHEGVSPASAGGAPAPNPATVDNSIAYALTHHYGFLPLNVRYRAAQVARAIVEQSRAEAPLAEILPAEERKPVYSEPGVDTDWDEDADAMLIHGVGWSLAWGCKLSIARDHDTGEHYVCVNTSGEDQRKGIVSRSTTREQIASFGQQLLNVFGEPDPRDAEIDRLTRDLRACEITRNDARSQCDQVRVQRDNVTRARDEWRKEWERADAEVTRLVRCYDAVTARADSVEAERDDYAGRLRDTDAAYAKVTAERDRLRQELDCVGEQRPKFQPEQRVRVGNGECFGTVHTTLERYSVEIDDVHFLVDLPPAFLTALPDDKSVEPRRWVAGDPEPEIGTTVRQSGDWGSGPTWTRRRHGWHPDHDCSDRTGQCGGAGPFWSELPRPLVEVVNSDGD